MGPQSFKRDSVSRREPLNCTPRKLLPVVCALLPRLNHCDTNLLAVWLSEGLAMVFSFIMESGAKGCEVVVSGKLRGQRAKSMKFVDGLMIHSGEPTNVYVDSAVRHVLLRQGVLGIRVKIMLPWDRTTRMVPNSHCQTMCLSWNPKKSTSLLKRKLLSFWM